MSGKASLINNLEELGLNLNEEEQVKVLERIVKLGDSKQVITPEDLPFIIADVMESRDVHLITLKNCYVSSGLDVESTASIRVDIEGEEYHSSGSGNGGIAAFINAILKILEQRDFQMPELVDFEVHIPRGGDTNALTEAIITWGMEGRKIKTRGVDSNQVLAAIKATMRMINMALQPEQG